MTKLDQAWANNIVDGVKAMKLDIERLEAVGLQLESYKRFWEEFVSRRYEDVPNIVVALETEVKKNIKLKENNRKLAEALLWYASKADCWFSHCDELSPDLRSLHDDGGDRASKALEENKELK